MKDDLADTLQGSGRLRVNPAGPVTVLGLRGRRLGPLRQQEWFQCREEGMVSTHPHRQDGEGTRQKGRDLTPFCLVFRFGKSKV